MEEKITVSLMKADVGSLVGHGRVHPDLIETAKECLQKAKDENLLIDFFVTAVGDDLQLLMTHKKFIENPEIHKLAFDTFMKCAEVAKSLKLYGAGQDLLSTSFSGNLKGMGPGTAEMSFVERPSEPMVALMLDKAEIGALNLPLFKIYADPMTNSGLVIDPELHKGFTFEVHDVIENKKIRLKCPEEMYDLLALISSTSRYLIKSITRNSDGEIAAVMSTQRVSLIAKKYVGKDDGCALLRSQHGMPCVGEILEPFAMPHLVKGFCRGSHLGCLMPVSLKDAHPTRYDGPPRICAIGFQLKNGEIVRPVVDLFDDPAFDLARQKANEITEYLRSVHGVFEPERLEETEYTTLPQVLERLKEKFEKI